MENKVNWPEDVGILTMEVYTPVWFVEQAELERYDGAAAGKYTVGLGQDRMAFCSDREDVHSLCLTVTHNLLERSGLSPSDIGRLEVGTETIVDKSKSVKTVLMQLFGDSTDLEGVDTTNACYGGTAALFNAVNWVESSAWDGRLALVVCADIAVYAKGAARPTGGAGAVAMLVGPHAPLVLERGVRSSFMTHAYDFYKPDMGSEYPVVDGPLSIRSYFTALDKCYARYRDKAARVGRRVADVRTFDGLLFHCPYSKLVQKSVARLCYSDFLALPAEERAASGLPQVPLEQSYFDKEVERAFLAVSKDVFASRTEPSLWLAKQVGNMYTPSLYGGLASHLLSKPVAQLAGTRLGLFSYGSGLASSFFSIRISEPNSQRHTLEALVSGLGGLKRRLEERTKVAPEEFEATLVRREHLAHTVPFAPSSPTDGFYPGTYYLEAVDDKHRRSYQRVPPAP